MTIKIFKRNPEIKLTNTTPNKAPRGIPIPIDLTSFHITPFF